MFLMEAQDLCAKSQKHLASWLQTKLPMPGAGRGSKGTCTKYPLHARH